MYHKKLIIGLFGFGVVGEGLYQVLRQTTSLNATIKKICIKDAFKKRSGPAELFTTDKSILLDDPEINVIIEVINESEPAFEIVFEALTKGKAAVSANKKMIAEHLPELLELQKTTNGSLLYEAAACASIPVIRNLEEYYDNDLLHSIKAIVNGSTNFILTKIFEESLDFKQALIKAQQLGFAETDPKLDVEGHDSVNKWAFLLTHAYGLLEKTTNILFKGIQNIHLSDSTVARSKQQVIKLIACAKKLENGKVAAFVLPQFIESEEQLAFVKNEYNGVIIESSFSDKQFFYGKGAGSFPTASAILSDISALRYGYKYEYKKLYHHTPHSLTNDFYLRVYLSFDDVKFINRNHFEWIEEWHDLGERKYLTGGIHLNALSNNNWWKENNNSLILLPDPVVENLEIKKLKRKSLELAGLLS